MHLKMLSLIFVQNCLSIGGGDNFSANLIFYFDNIIKMSLRLNIAVIISLDKTNVCKCNNISLIKFHQREIHNGMIRYGDVPQHMFMTLKNNRTSLLSKNTDFYCPLPVSAHCS